MIIVGKDKQEIEIKTKGYEFPDSKDYYDANWLVLSIRIKTKNEVYQTEDPALLTWELKELADWFLRLSKNEKVEWNPLEFMEPTLSFELLTKKQDLKKIRINLNLYFKTTDQEQQFAYDFELKDLDMKKIAEDLKADSDKFKKR